MSKHVKGILAMPSFSPQLRDLLERTDVPPVTPSCSEYEVRYRQGRQAVHDSLSALSRSAAIDLSDITAVVTSFAPPVIDIETPVAHIMYYAGINYAIQQINDYLQGIGD